MAQISIEAMQKLLDQWPTVDQVFELPDFLSGFAWHRHYYRCDPVTDDMRQMLDDLGIEPGMVVDRVPASSIFIGVDYGVEHGR